MNNYKKILKENILKYITIFFIGFVYRWFINDIFDINVFYNYTHILSIFYYYTMLPFAHYIHVSDIKLSDLILGIKYLFSNFINDNKIKMGLPEDGFSPKDNTSRAKGGKSLVSPISKMEGTSSSQSQAGSSSQAQGRRGHGLSSSSAQPQAGSSSQIQVQGGPSSSQNPPSTNPPSTNPIYDPALSFPRTHKDAATWLEYKRSEFVSANPHISKYSVALSRIGISDKDENCVDPKTRQILVYFILRNSHLTGYRQLTATSGNDADYINNWPRIVITNKFIKALKDTQLEVLPSEYD